ncbi:MAG: hypothetical protein KDC34_01585 [Saprospiraceae bacterium]|nr:hypothetical protein [Saprospiraceae bacterium]
MKSVLSIVFAVLFCAIHTLHAGGGWPQPKGQGYFKLYEWWVVSDRHYTDIGLIDPNVTTGIFNTSFYGEYGFTDRITGVLNVPLFSRTYFNNSVSATTGDILIPGEAVNSFGDLDLGITYGLIVGKPVALSATLILGLPTGNPDGGSTGILQTGDGEFNQFLKLDAGTGFKLGKVPAYANIYTGFNNRSNGFSDEFRYGAELGLNLFNKKIWAIGRLTGVRSFQNGDPNLAINSTSVFANNSEYLSLSPELAYNINDKWGVSASAGFALSGRIIFAAPSYSVGVFYQLK